MLVAFAFICLSFMCLWSRFALGVEESLVECELQYYPFKNKPNCINIKNKLKDKKKHKF